MEWVSKKWENEHTQLRINWMTDHDPDYINKCKQLEDKNRAATNLRYTFRAFIFLTAWLKFLYSLYVVMLAWNMVIVPYTGWQTTTVWGVVVLRVAGVSLVRITPNRRQLDQLRVERQFEKDHMWFDRYLRMWEVVYMGVIILGLVHLFLIYAPLK